MDEHQDTNALQDAIYFIKLARPEATTFLSWATSAEHLPVPSGRPSVSLWASSSSGSPTAAGSQARPTLALDELPQHPA